MMAARRTMRVIAAPDARGASAKGMATPTMNRKKGKITSVGVQPCQSAWRNGEYTACHVPGLLTTTIAAIVSPRKASSERSRDGGPVTASSLLSPRGR
jgi:hypothetical protein